MGLVNPQAAPTPPSPIPAPVSPIPSAAPTAPESAQPVAHAPTPNASQTLQEVLAARREALNPVTPKPPEETPQAGTTPEPQAVEAPQGLTPEQIAAQAAMYQLAQQNPQQLIAMLQAAQPQQPEKASTDAPTRPTPEQYHQTLLTEAQEHIQGRPRITAAGMFGEENAEEMGIGNRDFSSDLEAFVQATMAPVLGSLLSNMYALQHHFDQQFTQVKPVLETHQFTQVQREAGKQLTEAFPALAQGDQAAIQYCDKRFNELAPILLPPEILNNPQSNPKEYARIMTSIARIAANEYSVKPPVNTPAPPTMPNPANVTPEPQPIAPAYRNHLGQFQLNQTPKTLDEFNRKRLETLFPKR